MTRRIVRTALQLCTILATLIITLIVLDNRYSVLPASIHNHLPIHHPGLIVTDVTIKQCSTLNPLSSCRLDPTEWARIEKDLYLNRGWISKAYLHVRRKKEEDLTTEDKVVLDIKISRNDPTTSTKDHSNEKWEHRPAGLWVQRSAKRHESDNNHAITAVDVLFGSDAAEPRHGWSLRDTPLLLDYSVVEHGEARLTVRHGPVKPVERPVPRIRKKDDKFKIMQISDLHLSTGLGVCRDPEPPGYNGNQCDADPRTLDFVGRLLDDEQPDLVVLSGDQVNGDTALDAESAIYKVAEMFVKRKIPYAAIFGNHDDEGQNQLSRAAQMALYESLPYSLSQAGPSAIAGVGNYYVEVLAPGTSTASALTLYFLDTHSYSPDEKAYHGYDWLKDNQVRWFRDTIHAMRTKQSHDKYAKIHLEMAFIHIPLPEYRNTAAAPIVGTWKEPVTAPGYDSGFGAALLEQGVPVVSAGHDHVNDFCSLQKHAASDGETGAGMVGHAGGLWTCYAGGAGFGGYGGYDGYHRRVRFFEIDTNGGRITTWKRVEYGDTGKRLDEQLIVEAGKVHRH